jgi:hypothetical protein
LRIAAILSDYDGTLCPTGSLRSQNNAIPQELDDILWTISEKIPICIVSSKDFNFLHSRTRFAVIISCILGIETLVLSRHERGTITTDKKCIIKEPDTNNLSCIKSSHLLLDTLLHNNSKVFASLAEDIELKFKEQVIVERKFTTASSDGGGILAGVTIDWRHLEEWGLFKKKTEPALEKMINKQTGQRSSSPGLYIQTCLETMNDGINEIIDRCGIYNLEAEFNPAKKLGDNLSIEVDAFPSIPTTARIGRIFANWFINATSSLGQEIDLNLTEVVIHEENEKIDPYRKSIKLKL